MRPEETCPEEHAPKEHKGRPLSQQPPGDGWVGAAGSAGPDPNVLREPASRDRYVRARSRVTVCVLMEQLDATPRQAPPPGAAATFPLISLPPQPTAASAPNRATRRYSARPTRLSSPSNRDDPPAAHAISSRATRVWPAGSQPPLRASSHSWVRARPGQ